MTAAFKRTLTCLDTADFAGCFAGNFFLRQSRPEYDIMKQLILQMEESP